MMLECKRVKFIVAILRWYLFRLHSQITLTSTYYMVVTTL